MMGEIERSDDWKDRAGVLINEGEGLAAKLCD